MGVLTIYEPDEQFIISPPGCEDTKIVCRVLSDDEKRRIRKAHTKSAWKHGVKVEDVDAEGIAKAFLDAAIVSWTGVVGTDGQERPCTLGAKLSLPASVHTLITERAGLREFAGDDEEGGKSAGEA